MSARCGRQDFGLLKDWSELEEGEDIELYPRTLDDAIEMIREGEIVDSKTISTLLMYERFSKTERQG